MDGHTLAGADHKVLISIVIKVRKEGDGGLVQPVESRIRGDLFQAAIGLREEQHIGKVTGLGHIDIIDAVTVCVSQCQTNQSPSILVESPDGEFVRAPMDQPTARQAFDQFFSAISE